MNVPCALAAGVLMAALPAGEEPPTTLDVRVDAWVDLYSTVRAFASSREEPSVPEPLENAVRAAREVGKKLPPGPLSWWVLDCRVPGNSTSKDWIAAMEALPDPYPTDEGPPLSVRAAAVEMAHALAAAESWFLEELWPEHEAALAAVEQELEDDFLGQSERCLQFAMQSLNLDDPHRPLLVYLVWEAPWPGAVTFLQPGGESVSYVSGKENQGSLLHETLIHEVLHGLDTPGGAMFRLREQLESAGVPAQDRRLRDVPHALIFVQAGETIRRLLQPDHQHYGDAGVYARLSGAAAVRRFWTDCLDGRLTMEESLDAIVDAVLEEAQGQP